MARPNDPPQPPESIENLKRRFTRQNRDIVRNNSAQAIRIRNLETEVARLLDENLSLRQELIAETEEVTRLKSRNVRHDELPNIQSELEKKLAETSALVAQIGTLSERSQRKRKSERRVTATELKASTPTRESWQRRQMLMPSQQDQESRLPAITEGKSFPRLTLDPAELQTFIEADSGAQTDSPEIGPPPVAHFYEPAPDPQEAATDSDANAMVNLERRRKRRTSSLIADMEVVELAAEAVGEDETPPAQELVRSSAKRKLDASQLEDEGQKAALGSVLEQDKFVYHRRPALRPASAARKSNRFTRPAEHSTQEAPAAQATSPQKDSRKALAPKSANSPVKKTLDSKASSKGNDAPGGPVQRFDTGLDTRRRRGDGSGNAIGRPPTRGKTADKEDSDGVDRKHSKSRVAILSDKESDPSSEHDMPPKTPFLADDALSPPSTQPSAPANARAKQEAVIMNSVEDVLNGSIGRGSRRARAAVSYAEPNLRDKMRRPGKELVGAVEGYARGKREGSIGLEQSLNGSASEEASSSAQPSRWVATKVDKEEPGSPLKEKQGADDRRKRGALDIQAWARGESQALPRRRSEMRENEAELMQMGKNVEGLSIFDPPVSSPSSRESPNDSTAVQVHVQPSTSSRRRTGDRATTTTPVEKLSTNSSASTRRHSLHNTSSIGAASRGVSSRVSLNGAGARPSSAASVSRPSSAASNRSESSRDRQALRTSATAERKSSGAILSHRRTGSDVPKVSASVPSNASNISNSDVEDESDYEPTHLSIASDAIESSNLRATRRRSMVV